MASAQTLLDNLLARRGKSYFDEISAALTQIVSDYATVADRFIATSTSTVTVGSGTKTFTLDATGKSMAVGSYVMAFKTSDPTVYMIGQVTAFSDPTLTISVDTNDYGGSGSASAWTIALSAKPADLSSSTVTPTGLSSARTVADWLAAQRAGWVRVFPATTANGATTIYAPDGSVVPQVGTTTNGLQEAFDYARQYGYNLKAYGLNGAPLNAMFWYRSSWLTATSYGTQQVVVQSGTYYRCIVAHTSGTFATDLAAGKWQVFDYASLGTGVPTGWTTINGKQIYYRNTNYYMSGTLHIGSAQHMVYDLTETCLIYTGTGDAVTIDSGYDNTYAFGLIVATNSTSALKPKPTTSTEYLDGLIYGITALFHCRISVANISVDPMGTGVGVATDTTSGAITECVFTLGEIQAGIPLQLDGVNDIRGCRITMERAYGPSVSGRYGIQVGTSSTNKKVYDNTMRVYAMPTAAGVNGIQIFGSKNTITFGLQDDEAGGALGTGIRFESTAANNTVMAAVLEAGTPLSDASGGANSVLIGNALDATVIGSRSPAPGTFTTLTATGNTTLGDAAADTVTINAKSVTAANKPAFLSALSSTATDVTGDGTLYTVICDSEVFDQGADYNNGTGVFTAPVTGRYRFDCTVCLLQLAAGHTKVELILTTSNRTQVLYQGAGYALADSAGVLNLCGSRLVDMDAGDTAYMQVRVSNGTKVVDLYGQSTSAVYTSFAGELVC